MRTEQMALAWLAFAHNALSNSADTNDPKTSCKAAAKMADAMMDEFKLRFGDDEPAHKYPPNPDFEKGESFKDK